jgi:hypothetical protein
VSAEAVDVDDEERRGELGRKEERKFCCGTKFDEFPLVSYTLCLIWERLLIRVRVMKMMNLRFRPSTNLCKAT